MRTPSEIKQRFRNRALAISSTVPVSYLDLFTGVIAQFATSPSLHSTFSDMAAPYVYRSSELIISSLFTLYVSGFPRGFFLPFFSPPRFPALIRPFLLLVWFVSMACRTGLGYANFYGLTFYQRRIKSVPSRIPVRLERVAAKISCLRLILSFVHQAMDQHFLV